MFWQKHIKEFQKRSKNHGSSENFLNNLDFTSSKLFSVCISDCNEQTKISHCIKQCEISK